MLALHESAAQMQNPFSYLEIGSYLGGSLQVVMRDPRCQSVMSIDPRVAVTPHDDGGGELVYADNSTARMLERLRTLPDVSMEKLATFEAGTDTLAVADLPTRPTYCFVDGEHTHEAVLRDARWCAEALQGSGVIAFHDYVVVGSAISSFLREHWRDVSFALAFPGPNHPRDGGGVFALELGGQGLLRRPLVERAGGSRWHSAVWGIVNRSPSVSPLLVAWALLPAVDAFVVHARHGLESYVRRRGGGE